MAIRILDSREVTDVELLAAHRCGLCECCTVRALSWALLSALFTWWATAGPRVRPYAQLDWASPDDVSQFLESRNVDETVYL